MKKMEENIVKALYDESRNVHATLELRNRIHSAIDRQVESESMEGMIMNKKRNFKKIGIVTLAACLLISMGCFAAGKITGYVSSSSNLDAYHSYGEMNKAEEKAGYTIKRVEAFQNGYTFSEGNTQDIQAQDDDGNAVKSGTGIDITYMRDDKMLSLYADQVSMGENEGTGTAEATKVVDGITIFYNKDTYKIVPPDYELTEEDKQNQLREDYFISYGSSEVYTQEASSVVWVEDGVTYDLMGFDVDVSADEMLQMAQEIIQQQ